MTKSFREVIADIKEGEVWSGKIETIYCVEGNGNIVIEDKDGDKRFRYTLLSQERFTLQRKKVSFTEAFKAYEEGKEIESCFSERIYSLEKENKNTFNYLININEIRGEWYINE